MAFTGSGLLFGCAFALENAVFLVTGFRSMSDPSDILALRGLVFTGRLAYLSRFAGDTFEGTFGFGLVTALTGMKSSDASELSPLASFFFF